MPSTTTWCGPASQRLCQSAAPQWFDSGGQVEEADEWSTANGGGGGGEARREGWTRSGGHRLDPLIPAGAEAWPNMGAQLGPVLADWYQMRFPMPHEIHCACSPIVETTRQQLRAVQQAHRERLVDHIV